MPTYDLANNVVAVKGAGKDDARGALHSTLEIANPIHMPTSM